ncbi:hypothetical protein [Vibrio sp. SCSIO 43136]|uniref:hypothetical protein n=1 Tax=Vibrio sp. SCSIO 43136 TaxID=2819101 RepID=UPI00207621EB|nr:hypothetical protein [Vibrio sp. SCSIO 43136]USD67063.1 hypothetical protein J4N39_20730 [Vibrio sp. SCSIO 43136]
MKDLLRFIVSLVWTCSFWVHSAEVHQHAAKEIGDMPVPQIAVSVTRDAVDGVNVNLQLSNYALGPPESEIECASVLQGHAHLFINGKRVMRLYAQSLHIPSHLLEGKINQIAVSLNSHQHENWIVNDQTVVASVFIDTSKEALVLHSFSSQPLSLAKTQ